MATDDEVIAQRKRVDDLRNQILEAKLSSTGDLHERENEMKIDVLEQEEVRLMAELAALRGDTTEAKTVDGYIVPMGTVSVETDTIDISPEEAKKAAAAPGESAEPVVVSVSEAPAPKPAPVTTSTKEV